MLAYEGKAPDNLYLFTRFPRMDQKGLGELKEKVELYPDLRLVIIDTLQQFRPPSKRNQQPYEQDYNTVSQIKKLADEFNFSLLIIHHRRKGETEDKFESISGTYG